MFNARTTSLGLLASIITLVACDSGSGGGPSPRPIDSTSATRTMNQRLDELLLGTANSAAQIDVTGSTAVVTQALDTPSACRTADTSSPDQDLKSTTDALDELLRTLANEAKEHVFRQEFVESDDGESVVYKISAASACNGDQQCTDDLTRNPVRFAVTARDDDTLAVSLLVGEARHNPGTAVLGPDKVSVRLSLAEGLDTLKLFASAEELQDFPQRLDGIIEASIEKRAANDFALTLSIVEKLDLLVGQSEGKPVAVTVLPSNPTTRMTINSVTNTLGYALSLGAVDVRVAGAALCDDDCGSKEQNGTFAAHLGGVTASFVLDRNATDLTLAGLGLGGDTTHVALDGDRLGSLDVNASAGRTFSVSFKKTSDGTLVTFDPQLDIRLAMMLNKLSESMRVDMPTWLSDEIFDVMLGGAARPSVLVPAPTCDSTGRATTKSQVQVVGGTLSLRSSSLASPVTVSPGMCLLPVEGADDDAHPFSQIQAGICQ